MSLSNDDGLSDPIDAFSSISNRSNDKKHTWEKILASVPSIQIKIPDKKQLVTPVPTRQILSPPKKPTFVYEQPKPVSQKQEKNKYEVWSEILNDPIFGGAKVTVPLPKVTNTITPSPTIRSTGRAPMNLTQFSDFNFAPDQNRKLQTQLEEARQENLKLVQQNTDFTSKINEYIGLLEYESRKLVKIDEEMKQLRQIAMPKITQQILDKVNVEIFSEKEKRLNAQILELNKNMIIAKANNYLKVASVVGDEKASFAAEQEQINAEKLANEEAKLANEEAKTEIEAIRVAFDATKGEFERDKAIFDATKGEFDATKGEFDTTKGEFERDKANFDAEKTALTNDLDQTKLKLSQLTDELARIKIPDPVLMAELEQTKAELERLKQDLAQVQVPDPAQVPDPLQVPDPVQVPAQDTEKAELIIELTKTKTALDQLKQDLELIQQDPTKDELINKLKQKLGNMFKQRIVDETNKRLNQFIPRKPALITSSIKQITLTTESRGKINDILNLFGGSKLNMKGGGKIFFTYDDANDALATITDVTKIKIFTTDEINTLMAKIKEMKTQLTTQGSSDNANLLMKELILTKTAHAQNFKSMLFEKIANGVNKKIIETQAPAIEQLKQQKADLETANKDLETKQADLLKQLTVAKNTATVSSGTTAAVTAAKTSLGSGSGSGSGSSSSNSSMFMDKNVIYYKMSPPIATA